VTNSYQTTVSVRRTNGRHVRTIETDAEGRFQLQLSPGKYTLYPRVNIETNGGATVISFPYAEPVRVVIPRGRIVPVTITYWRGF
jgi:hypothetical protein